MTIEIQTLSAGKAKFTDEQLGELQMMFRGPLIGPEDERYNTSRSVENLAIDRHPGLIIRCSGTADVIDGVNLAREHGLLLAVRAGGHHVGGHGATEGGLLLDLREMNGVWVDVENKVVRCQGGATWGQVDRETQQFGLVVPGGVVSGTGVGGLTLGGGIGWLHRKWGLSCDNLLEATVVTADGKLVKASATTNKDLFWGIRGGGGNFGIVVDFTFEAHELGPMVFPGAVFHAAEEGEKLLPLWRDWALQAGDEITTRALYWSMPVDDSLPPPVQGKDVFIMAALVAGDQSKAEKLVAPLRALGTPLADISGLMPYRGFQSAFDALSAGHHSYWKSTYLSELTDEAIALIHKRASERPDPKVLVHIPIMGGATAAVPEADTAFGDRSAPFMLSIDGNTYDAKNFENVRQWVKDFIGDVQNLSGVGGAYLNFSGDDATEQAVIQAQFGQNLTRLKELKKKYDPTNLFRVNNNIQPA
ncbi:MAG: FAD-binding oxidoreductase [Actinomycetota bacterium]